MRTVEAVGACAAVAKLVDHSVNVEEAAVLHCAAVAWVAFPRIPFVKVVVAHAVCACVVEGMVAMGLPAMVLAGIAAGALHERHHQAMVLPSAVPRLVVIPRTEHGQQQVAERIRATTRKAARACALVHCLIAGDWCRCAVQTRSIRSHA